MLTLRYIHGHDTVTCLYYAKLRLLALSSQLQEFPVSVSVPVSIFLHVASHQNVILSSQLHNPFERAHWRMVIFVEVCYKSGQNFAFETQRMLIHINYNLFTQNDLVENIPFYCTFLFFTIKNIFFFFHAWQNTFVKLLEDLEPKKKAI